MLELAIAHELYDALPRLLGGAAREDPLARRVARELRGRRARARPRARGSRSTPPTAAGRARRGSRGTATSSPRSSRRRSARSSSSTGSPRSSRPSSRRSPTGSSTRCTTHVDHKTELQEALARSGRQVAYVVLSAEGPPHERHFTCAAMVDGEQFGVGSGGSKKAAEQEAAREALAARRGRNGDVKSGLRQVSEPVRQSARVPLACISVRSSCVASSRFPDPVEVRLEPGVGVIVGPNGSGKSNVADAIRWAAGSLSPNELRAEKPDDVLFAGGAGSRRRPTSARSSCSSTTRTAREPVDYSELAIARRLHRGGEGQYLVNRTPVRRLDLVELLADLGLGQGMHSIIGQGKVEAILASRPEERRALIEEAAGLGRFKARRHRAELKLARVAIQVERARDLEDEVRKRLRPLALQATAAERAEKLRREIARLRARIARARPRGARRPSRRGGRPEGRGRRSSGARRRSGSRPCSPSAARAEEELADAAGTREQAMQALYRLRSAAERLGIRRESSTASARAGARPSSPLPSRTPAIPASRRPELEQAALERGRGRAGRGGRARGARRARAAGAGAAPRRRAGGCRRPRSPSSTTLLVERAGDRGDADRRGRRARGGALGLVRAAQPRGATRGAARVRDAADRAAASRSLRKPRPTPRAAVRRRRSSSAQALLRACGRARGGARARHARRARAHRARAARDARALARGAGGDPARGACARGAGRAARAVAARASSRGRSAPSRRRSGRVRRRSSPTTRRPRSSCSSARPRPGSARCACSRARPARARRRAARRREGRAARVDACPP